MPAWPAGSHEVKTLRCRDTPASPPSPPSILWIGPSSGIHFDGASSKNTTDQEDGSKLIWPLVVVLWVGL